MKISRIITPLLLLVPLAACSAPTATEDPACAEVPPATVTTILDGTSGPPLKAQKSAAVQSADSSNWFIAIEFTHDTGTDVGVWQSNALEGGPIGSVDAFAKSYTNWPDTGNAGSGAQSAAENCLR